MNISVKIKIICIISIVLILTLGAIKSYAAIPACTNGEHSFKIETIRKATESTTGLERHTCSKCGYSYEESTPKTGHSYGSWQTDISPTCGSEGRLFRTCANCGRKDYKIVPGEGEHELGEWQTISKVSCTQDGKKQRHCKVCGYTETDRTMSGGHSYVITKTTSEDWEYTKYECSVCGHSYAEKVRAGSDSAVEEEPVPVEEEEIAEAEEKEKDLPVRIIEEILLPENVEVDVRATGLNEADAVLSIGNLAAIITFCLMIGRNLYVIKWDRKHKAAIPIKKEKI